MAIAAVSIVTWSSISNHCVLGALVAAHTQSATMQMPCHGAQSTPPNNGDEEMPCCKVLRATITGSIDVPSHQQTGVQDFVATELLSIEEDHVQPLPEEIDTGPPFVSSFAELILQRSLFSHAPPFLR